MIFKKNKNNPYEQFKSETQKAPVISSSKKKKSKNRFGFFQKNRFTRGIVNFFRNGDILKKIGVTLIIVVIYRALASIPLPGVDLSIYRELFGQSTASETSYLFTIFTGGRLDTPSIVGLGLAAYINASIIMQLLPYIIGRLKELQKEGERGRQVINQITRIITFPLSFVYSIAYLLLLSRQDISQTITTLPANSFLIPRGGDSEWPSFYTIIFMALILAAGTMLLMWLSEFITEKGLGNGSSVIISVGILSSLPALINVDLQSINIEQIISDLIRGSTTALTNPLTLALIGVIIGFFIVIGFIVFINESSRKIPIQYARRVRGEDGGQGSFLPIKFTITGVMPVIFAFALLSVPQLLIPIIENIAGSTPFIESLKSSFIFAGTDQVVNSQDTIYEIVYFTLVVIFGVFYSFIVLNPKETAENLQKSGAFVPGIRPGKSTENYIANVLFRIALVGSLFLALIAVAPVIGRNIIFQSTGTNLQVISGIGGTSILIIVGVLLDTLRQYKSLMATRSYDRYLK